MDNRRSCRRTRTRPSLRSYHVWLQLHLSTKCSQGSGESLPIAGNAIMPRHFGDSPAALKIYPDKLWYDIFPKPRVMQSKVFRRQTPANWTMALFYLPLAATAPQTLLFNRVVNSTFDYPLPSSKLSRLHHPPRCWPTSERELRFIGWDCIRA